MTNLTSHKERGKQCSQQLLTIQLRSFSQEPNKYVDLGSALIRHIIFLTVITISRSLMVTVTNTHITYAVARTRNSSKE